MAGILKSFSYQSLGRKIEEMKSVELESSEKLAPKAIMLVKYFKIFRTHKSPSYHILQGGWSTIKENLIMFLCN